MSESTPPTCPNCGNPVEFLVFARSVVECHPYYVRNGDTIIGEESFPVETNTKENPPEWCCPSCLFTIATKEEDAKRFLTGGKDVRIPLTYIS